MWICFVVVMGDCVFVRNLVGKVCGLCCRFCWVLFLKFLKYLLFWRKRKIDSYILDKVNYLIYCFCLKSIFELRDYDKYK